MEISPRSPKAQIRAREREAEIMRLRIEGVTWVAVAAKIGISQRGCEIAYRRALDRITLPTAFTAKRLLVEKAQNLEGRLWQAFNAATDPLILATLAGRILATQARQSALLGCDVPSTMYAVFNTPTPPDDQATVEALRANLTQDELRELYRLGTKASGRPREIETTAVPNVTVGPRAAAPDFDEPDPGNPDPVTPSVTLPQEVAAPVAPPWTRYDDRIAHLEEMLAISSTDDDKRKFQIQLADLVKGRDDLLRNRKQNPD